MAVAQRTRLAPAAFPPPVDSRGEFIKRELDAEDERIEVGVAIVGGGTAGLAMRQPAAAAARRRPGDDGAPRRGAGRGHREGQDLRRAQPVRRGHAPRAAGGALPRPDPRGLAQGGLRLRRGHQGGRLHDCRPPSARSASRRRRRSRTTATRSSRSPRSPATSRQQAEEGGAYILTETAATQLLVEDGRVARRPLRRQGPRQGRRAAGQLRARHRHHRQGHRAGRGLLGPPDRRRDPRVRPRPRAASRRSGSSASRRSGRSPSRWTA